jgi:hypothetical protein
MMRPILDNGQNAIQGNRRRYMPDYAVWEICSGAAAAVLQTNAVIMSVVGYFIPVCS